MGKTANRAVWLNDKKLSAYDYWQYWRNTEDGDVGKFLCLFTELPIDEIKRLGALEGSDLNDAKKILADQATALCHGEPAAQLAKETARKTFEEGKQGEALPSIQLSLKELVNEVSNGSLRGIPADYSAVPMHFTKAINKKGVKDLRR